MFMSGLRNFFLAFLISLLVCGMGAYFLINYITEAYGPGGPELLTGPDDELIEVEPDAAEMDYYRFTALIIGIDDGDSQEDNSRLEIDEDGRVVWPDEPEESDEDDEPVKKDYTGKKREADTIILVDINMRSREFVLSYLPRDMRVNVGEYTLRLGAVYKEHGADILIRTVKAFTGIEPDFYCVLDYDSIISLFDILGKVDYNVPVNMYHLPKPYEYDRLHEEDIEKLKPEIDLRAGAQRLDGEQIVQLLRFKGYRGTYVNEETNREETQKSFIQEVVRQQFTFENLGRANEIYEAVIDCIVETNMTEGDFFNYTSLIFGFSEFVYKEIEYPGIRNFLDGVYWFMPNHSGAVKLYEEYKK